MVVFTLKNQRLILPSPRLNNSVTLVIPAVIDHAKDGSMYAFRRQSQPFERHSLYFEHVNRPKILETVAFLKIAMGKIITYLDYENNKWSGCIINQPHEFTHSALRNNTFTLEFEGFRA